MRMIAKLFFGALMSRCKSLLTIEALKAIDAALILF